MFGKKSNKNLQSSLTLGFLLILFCQVFICYGFNSTPMVNAPPGTVVGFEESKFPMTVVNSSNPCLVAPGLYDEFAEQLENHSYIIDTLDVGQSINQTELERFDILVMIAPFNSYTAQEINEIDLWVKNGGSLLIITEWDIYGDGLRNLTNHFGFNYPHQDGLRDSDDAVGNTLQFYIDSANIATHDITSGINRIEIYGATGLNESAAGSVTLIDTDDNSTTEWNKGGLANDIPVLSALEGGSLEKGKLVIITDSNIWDNGEDIDSDGLLDFYDSDNAALALNIINWLSVPYTPTAPLDIFSIISLFTLFVFIIYKKRK